MKQWPMRWGLCALLALPSVSPAVAADLDVLRGSDTVVPPTISVGPATFTRWSGFYVGGSLGFGNANGDFSRATQPGVAYALRNTTLQQSFMPSQWQLLSAGSSNAASYGGFVGYNTQWQDLILGIEANINGASFNTRAQSTPIARSTGADSSGSVYSISMSGTGSITTSEFATLRARTGIVVGNFMPYGFVGMALGIANTSVTASGSGVQYTSGTLGSCTATQPCIPFSFGFDNSRSNSVIVGFTVGGGVDVALTPNVFARAEFEWDQFNPQPNLIMGIATGRVGLGFKF